MTPYPGRADEAAVLGVALAAAVSISTAGGNWELLESIVGVVLMTVIVSYYDYRQLFSARGERGRKASFAGVVGLCACLITAWPLQFISSEGVLSDLLLPLVWAATAGAILALSMRR